MIDSLPGSLPAVAERVGFEPTDAFTSTVFKSVPDVLLRTPEYGAVPSGTPESAAVCSGSLPNSLPIRCRPAATTARWIQLARARAGGLSRDESGTVAA